MNGAAFYVAELCRLFVFVVFAASCAGKASAIAEFREALVLSFHVPDRLSWLAAFAIVGVEGAIAVLLVGGAQWVRIAIVAAMALISLFSAVILVGLLKGKKVRCNCFGGRGHVISSFDLFRNASLIAACGVYLHTSPAASADLAAALLLLGVAVILFLIATNLDTLAQAAR